MAAFHVVGIEWATEPKNRASAWIKCDDTDNLTVTKVKSPLQDEDAIAVCQNPKASVVAVDIPFGWPQKFNEFVGEWVPGDLSQPPSSENFRYRHTDLVVKHEAWKAPLSVSSNLIAIGAREWIDVCHVHGLEGQIDVLGEPSSSSAPRIIEVYPGGTLTAFASSTGLQIESYKSDASVRLELLIALGQMFSFDLAEGVTSKLIVGKGKESDRIDAIIAALTGLFYAVAVLGKPVGADRPSALTDWTIRCPKEDERELAQKEGWIFFPVPNKQ